MHTDVQEWPLHTDVQVPWSTWMCGSGHYTRMRRWWNWNTRQVENLVGREAHAGSNPALRTSSLESHSLSDCAQGRLRAPSAS
jgi:hypothetical protein